MSDQSLGTFCSVCIYIASYLAWGEVFRSSVDPWVRLRASRILGTPVVARQDGDEAFSIPLWRSTGPSAVERNGLLGVISAAWLLVGAIFPILGLVALCASTTWLSEPTRQTLYLMSWAFLAVFLIQQTRRKGHAPETRDLAPSGVSRRRDLVQLPREEDS